MSSRRPPAVAVSALIVFGLAVAACGTAAISAERELVRGSMPGATGSSPLDKTTPPPAEPPPTPAPAPAPTLPPLSWPAIPDDGVARAVVTPTGVVLPVTEGGDGRYVVSTPCAVAATVTGVPISGAHVVLDPGHGGEEPGAVGPNGLTEAEVNLAIAEETKRQLEASGAVVVLTRTADYRIALRTRAGIATALDPVAFVSIHHNAEPDGSWPGPGSETYYQIDDAASRRLAGLLWEEEVAALEPFGAAWVADTDAGAKYRLASDGGDYYGILSRSAGIVAVLSEAAFISNATEEALLATPEVRRAEAGAIARAIVRFVATDDPGSGFTEPYPRTTPAGPGGGVDDCEDPPLE